ncbi:membrane hypothetical protein [Candidatus Terasakiella magnetica]|uniref:PPM-type phosphatase domain-containing protein n=1 Tax=Candidatus Terasakiella magnetica TaxID=1867952 RepID=A0A1C3RJV9_9PROT|nr:SpoIIE family protein phosphatase [Candidatus Terasakiella magnetica]SCA57517.1 membrane hypothetical protein [Candidatus Terasakiella magnetica]
MGELNQPENREYNDFVNNEIIEDYSLRYSPSKFRTWSEFVVSNTAIGSISFLALEAIGASIALSYGFYNAFYGILVASLIIFIMGAPICYRVARHNIDIDLLTRAAGFGYLGSTVTSLIYASFCFIFFALEAAIMAQAIYLYTGLPLSLGYIFCSLIIVPVVFLGMTAISRLQMFTQPIWLILMIIPFIAIFHKEPDVLSVFLHISGDGGNDNAFSWYAFGTALGISLSLIAQIGEQADYLRFMPNKTKENRIKWWSAVILAGPGWAILGFLKQIGGILLAAIVLIGGASIVEAKEPIHMYTAAFSYVVDNPNMALLISFVFVIISQIKINVTNAYAGSLAWSNFFSRTTHTHLGRAVWVLFNIAIALMLMLMGVFEVLEKILGLYSNVAIAWVASIFADLVINKPLKLSPPVIEFKRAHLFNINPVGSLSTLIASILSIVAFSGTFGAELQAFSSLIALFSALALSPLICILTKGKYYIARPAEVLEEGHHTCKSCHDDFDAADMATCPWLSGSICSVCCSVEGRCNDVCKTEKEFDLKERLIRWLQGISKEWEGSTKIPIAINFLSSYLGLLLTASFLLWTSYIVQIEGLDKSNLISVKNTYFNIFYLFALLLFVAAWLLVLMQQSKEYVEVKRREAELQLNDAYSVISSSVHYASNIQQTILPDVSRLEEVFADYFVIWEPRDVVGGDIYWCRRWGDGYVFINADCTGHGVPGAFLTLIATGALDRARHEVEAGKLGALVTRMHQIVKRTLNQHTDYAKSDDGLELGACYIPNDNANPMIFVGARFSLFVSNGKSIEEIKGDKKGLGYAEISEDQGFKEHIVNKISGHAYYMTSDGLIDQVGGERRRGFSKKRFRSILLELAHLSMPEQKANILKTLSEYQGQEVRRDDISVLGFKVR